MNPNEKYQQQVLTTMTQGDMLQKLYEEIIKQIEIACIAIASNNSNDMDAALNKALRIVRYLRTALDKRFDVSGGLEKLYDFFDMQLVLANVKKDVSILEEIKPLIGELRDTFVQCEKIDRNKRVTAAMGNVV